MKTLRPTIALLCTSLILLNSFATIKNPVIEEKNDVKNTKSTPSDCFVIMTDGSTLYYTTLKLVTGVLTTPHLLADNKIIIYAKDVLAYQDKNRYAISHSLLITKKRSYVAAETLPGFAVRIAEGKLNVYSRKYYNGNNTVTEYFLQSGEGDVVSYSPDLMSELVKDNPKASDFYNSKLKTGPNSKKLLTTADIYNQSQLLTKN